MPGHTGAASRLTAALALLPCLVLSMVLLVLAAAGAQAAPTSACAGAGTGQQVGGVALDAEQLGNAATVVAVTAGRRLPVYAAVVAATTAYTESALRNSSAQTDHDSEGLFQQRVSIYTAAVAADPVKATNAFLDRLTAVPAWQTNPVGVDAQAVQISAYPGRYQPNAPLGRLLVGLLWPGAAGAVPSSPPICPGGGGAGAIAGPHGSNVAGTTTIPAGFMISGTAAGAAAVGYALAQLGKPYLFGAAGPAAFDCSGLTMAAWASVGVGLPHHAAAQAGSGTPVPTNLSQAAAGDLAMIPGADGTAANPGHVGMVAGYVDRADGRHLYLVQAPMSGVPVELTQASEWAGQIVDVRHIG